MAGSRSAPSKAALSAATVAAGRGSRLDAAGALATEARCLSGEEAVAAGLADEVARQVRRQIAREIAEVESFLRDAARRIADRHGLDFRTIRAELRDQWRSHRGTRAGAAATMAEAAGPSDAELDEDI